MAFDATQTATASKPALRGYRCDECKAVTHLSDLNDDMMCAICAPPEPKGWVARRELLEG